MRKRIIALICVALVLIVGSWILRPQRDQVNNDSISRIERGMTLHEVESILGAPPGDYTTREVLYVARPAPGYRPWLHKNTAKVWASNDAKVAIHFDDSGRVEGVFPEIKVGRRESLWDRFRKWLRL